MTTEEMRRRKEKAQRYIDAGHPERAQREMSGAMFQIAADGVKSVAGFFGRRREEKEREREAQIRRQEAEERRSRQFKVIMVTIAILAVGAGIAFVILH